MSADVGQAMSRIRSSGSRAQAALWRQLAPAMLAGGLMIAVAAGAFAAEQRFVLRASGDPDARFSGECRLETEHGAQVVVIDGGVPQTREMMGRGLSCRITNLSARSLLTIEIARDGRHGSAVSRSSSLGGGTIALSVR